MKKLTSQEKAQSSKALIKRICELHKPGEKVRFMEVCGTHTVAIFREGLRQVLPEGIELISGPGCPVCVTDQEYMDKAIAYAKRPDVILATFGDMLKVPGTSGTLDDVRAQGASIHVIYSPLEVLALGKAHPDKKIVFLGIGFETTIAVIAGTIKCVEEAGLTNVFFLISHKLVPPALKILLDQGHSKIDGFILPGHVSVIIGEEPYRFLAEEYKVPSCIAGFDGLEILAAIADLLEQGVTGRIRVGNTYSSVVMQKGNLIAQKLIGEMYELSDDKWRGMGVLPQSGLALRGSYARFDAEKALPLTAVEDTVYPPGCQCDKILQGILNPDQCRLFGKTCTAEHPVGACMVSVEGTCAAWYKYGQSKTGLSWEV